MMARTYQICTKCVMDTTDIEIVFDDNGVCNHCCDYIERKKKVAVDYSAEKKENLPKLIQKVKDAGKSKKYDCIVGVSGGVDSSYVAYLAKQWGLNALLVHLDNGWDSELAVKNIENIVKYTGYDLYTLVIDPDEFRDLQRAFLKADVIDLELLSDHAIFATVHKLAREYGIRYILSGENFETEAIMPKSWNWRKFDAVNIKAIHRLYGERDLRTFPFMGTAMRTFYYYSGFAKSIPVLNYIEYNKEQVMSILESEIGWRYYGGKHYESIFTRFYQGYILPKKFGIDKRKAHHSTLINSGQMTREYALEDLKNEVYPNELQQEDFKLVCKKLGLTSEELENYIKRPQKHHLEYDSDENLFQLMRKVYRMIKRVKNL